MQYKYDVWTDQPTSHTTERPLHGGWKQRIKLRNMAIVSSLQLHNYQIALLQPGISALLRFCSLRQPPKGISTVPHSRFSVACALHVLYLQRHEARSRLSSNIRNHSRYSRMIALDDNSFARFEFHAELANALGTSSKNYLRSGQSNSLAVISRRRSCSAHVFPNCQDGARGVPLITLFLHLVYLCGIHGKSGVLCTPDVNSPACFTVKCVPVYAFGS